MSNVKLAIRVRPFTECELRRQKQRPSVVTVEDHCTVTITNLKVSTCGAGDSRERVRRYTADYTFDSTLPEKDNYASQDTVFSTVGRDVLASLARGRSTCVLAYGQSCTGKTHTMMGSDEQPGLVPRLCSVLAANHKEITVSFLEIYNERVHDLLVGEVAACASLPRRTGNARKDLRVREHPTKGTYVQNLRRVEVHDAFALLSLVQEGAARRRTAATRRNSTSSRSHALLELATPHATLHLADLAGSEKASWEGCSGGGRQKEGANINKSLVALSNVISALVNAGGSRSRFVPYRDSALTWLLRDCFTGGANTFIIATVSPSVECYGESASTLRWAARARQLPVPRAPLHPPQATRAALQTQLTALIAELTKHFIRYVPESGKIYYEDNHWSLDPNRLMQPICYLETKQTEFDDSMDRAREKNEATNSESTASSVASGSSDKINVIDRKVKNEINKEMDKLFGPALERARSGTDLKVVAQLRNKRRQYKSQEVLPLYKSSKIEQNASNSSLCSKDIPEVVLTSTNSQDTSKSSNCQAKTSNVPIYYDNEQRAEIVASVTERLYNKLKKKEESTVSKVESVLDKKIIEPLSELRICTNARQRLMELSHKALKNKRRIGIPAYTQTRKLASRVREQAIDVQKDLEPYYIKERLQFTPHQDVGTETRIFTPRCKETAVGPKHGSIYLKDTATLTDENKSKYKNSFAMTDGITTCDRCTQTNVVPPPRKKKHKKPLAYAKYISQIKTDRETPVININISSSYGDESQPSSEDCSDVRPIHHHQHSEVRIPPDLITNHEKINALDEGPSVFKNTEALAGNVDELLDDNGSPEFPFEELSLPRVTTSDSSPGGNEMKDLILGRNENLFPYNIVLSPPRAREVMRTVKFKNIDIEAEVSEAKTKGLNYNPPLKEYCSEMSSSDRANDIRHSENDKVCSSNESSDFSNVDSDKFYWKSMKHRDQDTKYPSWGHVDYEPTYTPVYKTGVRNMKRLSSAKAKCYKQFSGLDDRIRNSYNSADDIPCRGYDASDTTSKEDFKKKRQFFEDNLEMRYNDSFAVIERNFLKNCNRLESSVNKYDQFLKSCRRESEYRPSEYLKHLVQLRRNFIKEVSDEGSSTASGYTNYLANVPY